jgi:hypothetical protein
MRGYNTDTTREFAGGLAFNRNKCGTMIARLHLTGTSGGDTDLVGDHYKRRGSAESRAN